MFDKLKNKIGTTYQQAIKDEFIAQGHNLSGKAVQSIDYSSRDIPNGFEVSIDMIYYGNILNKGVTPERIPFGESRAAKSKYIEGLKRYAQRRMKVSPKKALSIAFAIAKTQKKEGMPTYKSRRFSKTGRRKDFVKDAVDDVQGKVNKVIQEQTNLLLISLIQEV